MIDPNELLDLMEAMHPDQDPEEAPRPDEPPDAERANWALGNLRGYYARLAKASEFAKAEHYRVDQWFEAEKAMLAESITFFEGIVRAHHLARLAEDPKLRTLSLPNGSSSFRKTTRMARDESRILDWLEEQKIVQFTKRGLAWADFKKETEVKGDKLYYKGTGELVPSVEVTSEDSHSVDAK